MNSSGEEVVLSKVLEEVVSAIPEEVRPNIIVIGSLAAGFWLFPDQEIPVRTKDADCVLSPRLSAVEKGQATIETLITAHWKPNTKGKY